MTEAQYKLAKDQEREKAIKFDKKKIDDAIESKNDNILKKIHVYIDGKYGAYVPNWNIGMYAYIKEWGFDYEHLDYDSYVHNLSLMKAKLEGYSVGFEKPSRRSTYAPNNSVNVSVSNNNEVNISVSFDEVRKQVEDMTSLTDEQTREVLDRINEIETICEENGSKKSKWEKAKPVLAWLADKSFDVGMALLPLLLKMGE